MKHLYLSKWKNLQTAACFLFMFNMACYHHTARPSENICLSAYATENSYLKCILYSCNSDSVADCAIADFKADKYYLFITTVPGDEKFNQYLSEYAKQQYSIILVNSAYRYRPGAYYYNNTMTTLLQKINKKPFDTVYLEAKSSFGKLFHPTAGNL